MVVFTENARPGEAILSEGMRSISRDNGTIAASQTIPANSLVARVAVADGPSVTQEYDGTGNGLLTLDDPPVTKKVKDGVYKVICIEKASNSGTFSVEDPTGKVIGTAVVGTPFEKEVCFTIADGATDFEVGDVFLLTVSTTNADFEYVAYDPDGSDGSEVPCAYSIYDVVTGSGETKQAALITRMAELNGHCIAWPEGITDDQKTDAIQALAENNIIVRF